MQRFTGVLLCGLLLGAATSCTSGSEGRPHVQPTNRVSTGSTPPSPGASPKLSPDLAHMLKIIHGKGYQTYAEELRNAADFSPALRPVLVAKPRYLGNGFRCANVFFFSHGRYVGRDSTTCHLYPDIAWGGLPEVSIVYPRYGKHDALCCPTPDPVRVIFRLTHGHMKLISGSPPGAPD